jgi:hypothetical protein
MTLFRFRRALIVLCVCAVLWAIVLSLTSGISLSLGPIRFSSQLPLAPLIIAIVSGLAAWVLGMPAGAAVPASSAPRRARAIALVGLMVLGLNVLMLGQSPIPTDQDYCMSDTSIGKGFRHILNCDSQLFMMLAKQPSLVLTDRVRQSRPLAFGTAYILAQPLYFVPWLEQYGPYRPFAAEFVAYLLINLVLLIITAVMFARLLNSTMDLTSSPELLLGVVVLVVNDITKIFFWTPHVQIYNLFIPCLTMWLVYRSMQRHAPMRAQHAVALGLALGLGLLVYGAFLIPLACTAAIELLRHRRILPAVLISGVSLGTYGVWVGFVLALRGSFYSHEVEAYRQFVWMLDCAAIGHFECVPIGAHNLWTFFKTSAPVLLLPLALLFGLRVSRSVWAPVGTVSETMTRPVVVAIRATLLVTAVFLALMGFYSQRLTWLLVPPLLLEMALELRAWRLSTDSAGWWRFNWITLGACLLYVGTLLVREGPYR